MQPTLYTFGWKNNPLNLGTFMVIPCYTLPLICKQKWHRDSPLFFWGKSRAEGSANFWSQGAQQFSKLLESGSCHVLVAAGSFKKAACLLGKWMLTPPGSYRWLRSWGTGHSLTLPNYSSANWCLYKYIIVSWGHYTVVNLTIQLICNYQY